jgi:L-rhamnonate dehydratase
MTKRRIRTVRAFYPRYARTFSGYQDAFWQFCVEIETADGLRGLGVGGGGLAAVEVVNRALAPLLNGRDPEDVESLWEQMHREVSPYGQKGVAIMAISAVDLALWDWRGKRAGKPVCELIAPGSKDRDVKAYVTGNDVAKNRGRGFKAFKVTHQADPQAGEAGKDANVAHVRKARELAGDAADLMLDCWMQWDADYTLEMAERLAPYRLKWIEEPLIPDDYAGYGRLCKEISSTMIATGEHEYTRYGFATLAALAPVAVWQPDVTWCGGITELLKISSLAKAKRTPVVLHRGGEVWGLHAAVALGDDWVEYADPDEYFSVPPLRGAPEPREGRLRVTGAPGFGVEWHA